MSEIAFFTNQHKEKPLCNKCHGNKYYSLPVILNFDSPAVVEVKCEQCCEHELGFYKLGPMAPPHLAGRYACRAGCGYVIDRVYRS